MTGVQTCALPISHLAGVARERIYSRNALADMNRVIGTHSLAISLSEEQISPSFIKKLKEMLEPVSGGTLPINVYYQSAKGRALLRLGIQWSITPTDEILTELVNLLGENAVELEFG